jgi:cytidine deaminase
MEAYLTPLQAAGKPLEPLLRELEPLAAARAIAPISRFHVGAVGVGASGAIYLGFNLEFPGQDFHQAVHAEQFVVALAAWKGESALTRLHISVAPCGHCRQFLCELNAPDNLRITIGTGPETGLAELIPGRFGPADLGVDQPLFAHSPYELELPEHDELSLQALEAARRSYSPYSGCPAGVALRIGSRIYAGSLLENAAYNPTLLPLQAALVDYYSQQSAPPRIEAAALVEAAGPVSQRRASQGLLETLAPGVELAYTRIEKKLPV